MSRPTAYILTSDYNEYDQYGVYFIAWFHRKRTVEELESVLTTKEGILFEHDSKHTFANRILAGGGRSSDKEDQWYNLITVKSSARGSKKQEGAQS